MGEMNQAKYLLRFDDICPTMNWTIWSKIEPVLREHNLLPILAVIPDNQDETLHYHPPVHDFWARVRQWQADGWSIALHGYQHRYVTQHAGILGINRFSEFAGLSAWEQEDKLRAGLNLFHREGITTRIWIAPAHSFDKTTVSLLPGLGLDVIVDGFARYPYVDTNRIMWVPQQCWEYRRHRTGIWTICYHPSCWDAQRLRELTHQLMPNRGQIIALDPVLRMYAYRRHSVVDTLAEMMVSIAHLKPSWV